MIVLGIILFAVAVAAAIVLIVQNRGDVVSVHALGNTWSVHLYWFLVIGLVIAAMALAGLAIMKAGSKRARRLRQERRSLSVQNERLNEQILAERDPATHAPADPNTAAGNEGQAHLRRHPFRRAV